MVNLFSPKTPVAARGVTAVYVAIRNLWGSSADRIQAGCVAPRPNNHANSNHVRMKQKLLGNTPTSAGVAELADALDSGSSGRKAVQVQVLSPAPFSKL